MTPIRLLFAEDNLFYFNGLQLILSDMPGVTLCGTARNGDELLALALHQPPDVVLTDIQMPELDGIEATKRLHARLPQLPVIALTMYASEHLISDMMTAGARGYLDKNTTIENLSEAIHRVHAGGVYHCPTTTMRVSRLLATSRLHTGSPSSFTETEVQIIRLTCEEYSVKEIAGFLYLTESAIEKSRKRIQDKMGVRGTPGLVRYAVEKGIVGIGFGRH
ncbi:MAG: LuxR family transcriptional regulator [Flaviaesturariibacter sp.]|nr:LuxR family transcriptional regulator [Flaviaesturariibacter sp.]